jgi:hypothetical protein
VLCDISINPSQQAPRLSKILGEEGAVQSEMGTFREVVFFIVRVCNEKRMRSISWEEKEKNKNFLDKSLYKN